MLDYPVVLLVFAFTILFLSERAGLSLRRRGWRTEVTDREDLSLILTATLTLLGLIIGFTFSMAVNRYDQRKLYEEAEANAIGTEYLRADLLAATDAAKVRILLARYLDQRVLFYQTRNEGKRRQIDQVMSSLQADLWSAIRKATTTDRTAVNALVISGANDVLNSQGYTQAAWWNRIPGTAWFLMTAIAVLCSLLTGYGMRRVETNILLFLTLPLIVSIAFFLIADLDSSHGGIIRVYPDNLLSLAHSLRAG